jgi:hypothetical protein
MPILPLRASIVAVTMAMVAGCVMPAPIYGPAPQPYDPPPQYPPQTYSPPARDYDAAPAAAESADPQSYAQPEVEVQVAVAPPPLPDYEQPPCPEPGFLWTPGYWGYARGGYYWVPGTWVEPPQVGVLWTPGYWGWNTGFYLFHPGYWGPHVGFYGGVNYGGGYVGEGYVGGRWNHDRFAYNTAVNNVNTTIIHNTYNQTVVNNITVNRVSYNGGAGGVVAAPSGNDQRFSHERHLPPPIQQLRHINEASQNPVLRANVNQGRPPIAATPRAAAFTAPNIIGARGSAPLPRPQADGRTFEGPRPNGNPATAVPEARQPGQDASGRRQFNDPHSNNGAPNLPLRAQPQAQPTVRPAPDAPRMGPRGQPYQRSQPPASPQPQSPRPPPQIQRPPPQVQPPPKAAPPPAQRPRANPDARDPPDHDRR